MRRDVDARMRSNLVRMRSFLTKLMKNELVRSFIKFGIVGVSNTAVDFGVFYALTEYAGIHYVMATSISFVIATLNAFFWNRRWTFKDTNPRIFRQYFKFFSSYLSGFFIATFLLVWFVESFGINQHLAKLSIILIVMFWNFSLSKLVVFK